MISKILGIIKNPEMSGTIIVGTGMMIGSFFSYLLQLFLGRILSISDFGTFTALLSVSYLIGVPAGVFGTSLVKTVSELLSKNESKKLTMLFWKLTVYCLLIGGLVFFVMYLLRFYISSQLQVDEISLILVFSVLMSLSFINTLPFAYFQGLLRYKAYAMITIFGAFFRFIFPIILVFAGYRLYGAFTGLSLAALFTFILSYFMLKRNIQDFGKVEIQSDLNGLIRFSLPVMFVNFGMMLLNNLDMILVKRYFDSDLSGYYAGTVTLGKILLFGVGAVSTIMFPQIAALHARGESTVLKFKQFFKIQFILVLGGIAVFLIFPNILTIMFFGQRFIHSVIYLPLFSIFIGMYVLVNFMVLYFLAIGKTRVFLLLLPGVFIQYIMISLFHGSLFSIVQANIVAVSLVLILLFFYYLSSKKNTAPGK